ncbi:MAG TPA: hypothetical protein VGC58_01270 [Candidatus Paceibacterota bacterium]
MADEVKPGSKPESKPAPAEKDSFVDIVSMVVVLFIVVSLLSGIANFFTSVSSQDGSPWYMRFTPNGIMKANTRPISSLSNPVGARVVSLKTTDVYDTPGGRNIGSHKVGDKAKILQGPVEINGVKYYYVDFDEDPDGWVRENDIGATSVPLSSISDPMGSRVENANNASIYDLENSNDTSTYDPAGDNRIGSHKAGDKGTVIDGPGYVGGERYWYVDYDSDPDGWAKESDLNALLDEPNSFERFILWFSGLLFWIKLIFYSLCILIVFFIVHLFRKINAIAIEQRKLLYPEINIQENETNPKWERILKYLESTNENDWRLAIIEADIMLDELLEKMAIPGESIGDKLKIVERSDFRTLDNAWEAHKFRNLIAHEGSSFIINQREAKRIIGLFETVFREFEIIK